MVLTKEHPSKDLLFVGQKHQGTVHQSDTHLSQCRTAIIRARSVWPGLQQHRHSLRARAPALHGPRQPLVPRLQIVRILGPIWVSNDREKEEELSG